MQSDCRPLPSSVIVSAATADVFINAVRAQAPMTRLSNGTLLTTMGSQNEWFFVRFVDSQWGRRAGYVHCSDVTETPDSSNSAVDGNSSTPHVSDASHDTLPPVKQITDGAGTPFEDHIGRPAS